MSATTSSPPLPARAPEQAPTLSARADAAVATEVAPPTGTPIDLEHADLLCIRNGPGTRLRVASGVLWMTEEDRPEDHVLSSGAVIALARRGTAIVYTFRRARVVIEIPAGVAPPDAVETISAARAGERPIPLAVPAARSLTAALSAAAVVVGRAFAFLAEIATTVWPHPESGDASATRPDAPVLYSDGYPPRHLRRRWTHRSAPFIDF